jgi:putative nucleotidyltransferase with HDIG domain
MICHVHGIKRLEEISVTPKKTEMNPQSLMPGLRAWFEHYVSGFASKDPRVWENMELKAEHTRGVCKAIRDIGESLGLSREDLCIAEACALLHDIGRFEQYRQYRTFSDYRSEDHAALGAKIVEENGVLQGFEPAAADMIIRVVRYHNRALLPLNEEARCLFFLKLLRDADKVDIWRVVLDYYHRAGNNRNQTIELDLPDTDRISDPVYTSLMRGNTVNMACLKNLNDFKALQIGWVYDLNFPRTFQIVRQKRYLEGIRDALPKTCIRATEIFERARAYVERKTSPGKTP